MEWRVHRAMDPDSSSFIPPSQDSRRNDLLRHRSLPRFGRFEAMLKRFSPGERLLLYILASVFALSAFALLAGANAAVSVTVPHGGGSFTEGVAGTPRFLNPLLAISQPDADLSILVYSGLMRAMPDGRLVPDLASSYEISEDGTTYTFKLRDGLTFHDGAALTSADVLFTIQHAQNPDIRSQKRADWEGVVASAPDPGTVVFKLPRAYAPFLENTTLGILPRHLWEDVPNEDFPFNPLNARPVGSGPYRVSGFETDNTGAALSYELAPFKEYALGQPFIAKIIFRFYPNETALVQAYNGGRIDSFAGISPSHMAELRADTLLVRTPLPRTFGVFFNQSKNPVLADAAVRAALNTAIDRKALVHEMLEGYGVGLEGPIPPGVLDDAPPVAPEPLQTPEEAPLEPDAERVQKARDTLAAGNWKFDEAEGVWKKGGNALQFTLATADEPTLSGTAEAVAAAWRAAGVKVEVHVYPLSELNMSVIRPRNYEAVLFGEVVGRSVDLFAFWHSSQRNDPGLNLSLYTNGRADSLLAEARATTDKKHRMELYAEFASIVESDQPAVFLFAPEFLYVAPKRVQGILLGALTTPAERFLNVHEWYTDTERVWDIFTDKTDGSV